MTITHTMEVPANPHHEWRFAPRTVPDAVAAGALTDRLLGARSRVPPARLASLHRAVDEAELSRLRLLRRTPRTRRCPSISAPLARRTRGRLGPGTELARQLLLGLADPRLRNGILERTLASQTPHCARRVRHSIASLIGTS